MYRSKVETQRAQNFSKVSIARIYSSLPAETQQLLFSLRLLRQVSSNELQVFLHHMASFDGPKFKMTDGSYVQTKAIDVGSSTDISPYLSLIREDSISNGNRAVIFDVYWDVEFLDTGTKKSGWSLSSVKLSTKNLCLLLRLPKPFHDNLKDLYRFFASKFVTFVGVQIEEDLILLRENHGLVIRNAIEIGKLAAKARGTLVLEYLGTRELAYRVLWSDLSRLDSIEAKWEEAGSEERLEAAAIEGWLIFNVWEQLSE